MVKSVKDIFAYHIIKTRNYETYYWINFFLQYWN